MPTEYDLPTLISWASARGELKIRSALIDFKELQSDYAALRAKYDALLERHRRLVKAASEHLKCLESNSFKFGELVSKKLALKAALAEEVDDAM